MKLLFQFLCIALLAAACNTTDTSATAKQEIKTDTVSYIQQPEEQPKTIADEFIPVGDSLIVPPFEITVQLSEMAENKLKAINETIIISAMFSGIPKDTTIKEYMESGEFPIGEQMLEIQGQGTARFVDAKISKKDFEALSDKDIQVLINVYSGRRSDPNNLLDCDILQEPISKVRQQKNVLKGKLIGE